MGYSIYYDRAFIRVEDKYIPIVNCGSNNCYEYGVGNRMLCEKNWNVLNWKHSGQFLFTEPEIRAIAREYDEYSNESGMLYKTRRQRFAHGEFERWVINGMKGAHTVEEYVSFGNGLIVLDYSGSDNWKTYPFRTADEMLNLLDSLKAVVSLDIRFQNSREINRPKAGRNPKKKLRPGDLLEYYVLKGEYKGRTVYFNSLSRRGGVKFIWDSICSIVKVFETEKDAERYLKKYHNRLGSQIAFKPERVLVA